MGEYSIADEQFREAVNAIDNGMIEVLEELITHHPRLVRDRLPGPDEGYFTRPYLLWFVADNPIRIPVLPNNVVEVTDLLVRAVQRESPDNQQEQFDYALALVVTGRIPRESGRQIQMMDLLIDAGAKPGGGMGAVAHGNLDAARHLIKRGGKLKLGVAVCLDLKDDIERLLPVATPDEKLTALTAAAFYGKVDLVKMLLKHVDNINAYPDSASGFHSHATPLHQGLWSGSLETVKLLVEAGANLDMQDKAYHGTPLGWAHYILSGGEGSENKEWKEKIAVIAKYLEEVEDERHNI